MITDSNDLEAMPADHRLDVTDATGMPSKHTEQAVAAASAPKHIILEKPMANTPAEVAAIVKAADDKGVQGLKQVAGHLQIGQNIPT